MKEKKAVMTKKSSLVKEAPAKRGRPPKKLDLPSRTPPKNGKGTLKNLLLNNIDAEPLKSYKNEKSESYNKNENSDGLYELDHESVEAFPCPGCSRSFKSSAGLKRHSHKCESVNLSARNDDFCFCCGEPLETAHVSGDLSCANCCKKFVNKASISKHLKIMHTSDLLTCPKCMAQYPDEGTFKRHMIIHSGNKPYSCPSCKQEFSRKCHLIQHIMQTGCDRTRKPDFYGRGSHPAGQLSQTGEKPYSCDSCLKRFTSKGSLKQHIRIHTGERPYECETCQKRFVTKCDLTRHSHIHLDYKLRVYSCDSCPKRFCTSGALKMHRRTHTGERPYACETCHKRFVGKSHLNRHVHIHTGYKPHCCQFCGKSFGQSSQLKYHLFLHTGKSASQITELLPCEFCGKKFSRRVRLNEHIKFIHMGAKPLKCPTCAKTFIRKNNLYRHLISHTGVKAHKCHICEKGFAMKVSLKAHLLTHTKEPPRSCNECGKSFMRQVFLLRHMRTKHRYSLKEIMSDAKSKKFQQNKQLHQMAASEVGQDKKQELSEEALSESVRELLTLLVDEVTLDSLGYPKDSVRNLLKALIHRCGLEPVSRGPTAEQIRQNVKILFSGVIDESAVKAHLNNKTVDEVILHVLRLANS